MNVLWDLRLFSHGFGDRGAGRYTAAVAGAILAEHGGSGIYAWGDQALVPEVLRHPDITWIPYRIGSWKSSVYKVPKLVLRYRISLVHYWIALGPHVSIGISPLSLCSSVATVYDAGVARWNLPHGNFISTTPYWKMQKLFFRTLAGVITISKASRAEIGTVVKLPEKFSPVIYPPLNVGGNTPNGDVTREKMFLALGGSPHKNIRGVVAAFVRFRKTHPDYSLVIAGVLDRMAEGLDEQLPDGVIHQPAMERYHGLLLQCTALVYCSFHEGLGLPPLEAMQCGTPILVSSIPSLKETCEGFATFADPHSVESICAGMEEVAGRPEEAYFRARAGAAAWRVRSCDAARRCLDLYREVLRKDVRGDMP